jgi:hypothetical protein
MRIAIGATVLICGFVPAGQAPAGAPTLEPGQQGDAVWVIEVMLMIGAGKCSSEQDDASS